VIRAFYAPSVAKHVFVPRCWTVFTFNGDTYRQVDGVIEVQVGAGWVTKAATPMHVLTNGRIIPGDPAPDARTEAGV
jgi:hypothetical protein